MTQTPAAAGEKPWSRPKLTRTGPRRNAGGFYRTAEGEPASDGQRAPGGVPLNTANAAVVAAVRLAYEVAEAQIDRSTRLARRLRESADQQVGGPSDEKALDAAERIVQKAFLSGLEWWETSVTEGRCPVKRLAAAEYQMLGTLLGLGPAKAAPQASEKGGEKAKDAAPQRRQASRRLQVVHKGEKKDRRAVTIEAWDLDAPGGLRTEVWFHSATDSERAPIEAEVQVDANGADVRLVIATSARSAPGRWKCAVCDGSEVQVGFIEISL